MLEGIDPTSCHQSFTLHFRSADDKNVYAGYIKPFFQALKYKYEGIRYEWVKHTDEDGLHIHGIVEYHQPVDTKWFYKKWKYLRNKRIDNPYRPRDVWLRPTKSVERWIFYLLGYSWDTKKPRRWIPPWEGTIGRVCDGNLGRCS